MISAAGQIMSSPPNLARPDQSDFVSSLVLQSTRALHTGQQLCWQANDLSNAAAQAIVDVLALDAKVNWITNGVLEQLLVQKLLRRGNSADLHPSWLPASPRPSRRSAPV